MQVYKTTEEQFITTSDDGVEIYGAYDKDWIPLPQWVLIGTATAKLRSDSKLHKLLTEKFNVWEVKKEERTLIDKIKWFDVFLDKKTFELNIDINWEVIPLNKDGINTLKTNIWQVEKLKIEIKNKAWNYSLGDRVLIYWPTGTWKTYDFLSTVNAMKAAGTLDDYEVVTITEWMEDIDFLAHIVPTEKGIKYNERRIIKLLKDAAAWKRVAILLDELNRWGKSFLNLVLKLLDAVDGKNYVLSNFIKDETIVIPIENVLFFAAMNLGWKYVWTNALDEALLDRFNVVTYRGYDLKVEAAMTKSFWEFDKQARDLIKYVRELHKDGEIRAPISTRWVKMWAEKFINTWKTWEDFINSFNLVLSKRLISVDDFGNPNIEEESLIIKKFKDLGFID